MSSTTPLFSLLLLLFLPLPLLAQHTTSEVLSRIEQNNTTLIALRQTAEAEKLANRAELGLPDPEVEYGYLWGKPSEIGNRQDLSITQTFDAATLSGMKHRVASLQNQGIDLQYQAERQQLLLQARLLLIDLTYCNALIREQQTRLDQAATLVQAEVKRLNQGDGTLLDRNNAQINHTHALAELQRTEAERTSILSQLALLNGGEPLDFTADTFEPVSLPLDFNAWYADNESRLPALQQAQNALLLSRKQLSLQRTACIPSLTLGFMSEKTHDEHYRGLTAGISIPLWNGRRKVQQAKADIIAAESQQIDAVTQQYGQLHALYEHALSLQSTVSTYRATLAQNDNTELLRKALDAGQISLIEYIGSLSIYYDLLDATLSSERDYQKAVAELTTSVTGEL